MSTTSRRLLGLFDAAATGLADGSEFDAAAERPSIEVRELSREDLGALIESSTLEIPTTDHRRLHQEASDFVRWARGVGALETWPSTAGRTSRCSPAFGWGRVELDALIEYRAGSSKGRVAAACPRVYDHGVRVHK